MAQRIRKIGKLAVPLGERVRLNEGEHPLERTRIISAEKLGAAMRLRRRELGYTQKTAAALCGHSVRVISEIENGRASVGIGLILDYALVLGIDIEVAIRGQRS